MRRNLTQHHLTRALATCLTAGALTLGLGALPAQAESRTVTDARGDVRTFTASFDEEEEQEIDDQPSATSDGDILTATYAHTRRRMALSVSYADLERGHDMSGWVFILQGRNGQRRELELYTGGGSSRVRAEMRRSSNYRQVCRGNIRRTIDYAADRIDISFPRTCLESPRSFRVGHVSYWTESSQSDQTFYYDDPQRVGGSPEQAGSRFSPWVRRG